MRSILLFILAMLAIVWIRRALRKPPPGPRREADAPAAETLPERMVACAHCGLHVPESEGLRSGEAFYCSAEHLRLHQRDSA